MKNPQNKEILYKELSYEIVGSLYDTLKILGSSYQEKYYQKTLEMFLHKRNLSYKREYPVEISVEGKFIGRHFLDFLIEDKVILELKVGNEVRIADVKQVLMYLETTKHKLGILAYFGSKGVQYKRIIRKDS